VLNLLWRDKRIPNVDAFRRARELSPNTKVAAPSPANF
jgi:hypothetical protein